MEGHGKRRDLVNHDNELPSPICRCRYRRHRFQAFSLLEILVVLGLIAILAVSLVPALNVNEVIRARGVTETAFTLSMLIEQARSEAVARNTFVWLGIEPTTVHGNSSVRTGIIYSLDGSTSLAATNLRLAAKSQVLESITLTPTPVLDTTPIPYGSGNFTQSLIFTPAGEVLTSTQPSVQQGFPATVNLLLEQTRGTTRMPDNAITIRISGGTGIATTERMP